MVIKFFGASVGHVRRIGTWWRKNRPSAPMMFADELDEAFERLSFAPEVGPLYPPKAAEGLRRLLLPKTQYYVYYAVDRERGLVGIIAVWSCRRGRAPPLASFKGLRDADKQPSDE